MVPIKTLLPDLKSLVTELEEDLLARAQQDDKIDAGLREAFQQIEKGGRTAQAFEIWREDYLDQVAVAWVLACVFVRFMEDNHLIDECWLAGEKERRKLAEDTHELFFREHPHDEDREYFQHVFHEIGKIPAAKDLFDEGKTPLWAVGPSGDASRRLLKFWQEIDAETGHLKRTFEVEEGDTRFLGDLYQELSEKAKKKYALLQTPIFVEEFILDRTFNPAIDQFGLEKVRLIDPTCGSGHFLLGAFARLFRLWMKRESNEIVAAQKALDGVWGVDINPFAVAIARFRLIVAAIRACGIKNLKRGHAPGWKIHLAAGDSLLFGSRPGYKGERVALPRQGNLFEVPAIYAVEEVREVDEILGQGYHVVVGNPPYIIVRDRIQSAAYRTLYSTCHQKYSLGVPFTQRFWELAIQEVESNGGCGYIGMITTNAFMKREFGKKLIEEFFPRIDLTHVIDTAGAYIPGHGTPTAILFGRSRRPVGEVVRAVLGIKGEPSTPEDASQGLVWQSILKQIDRAGMQDDFVSTADVPRTTFNCHPWSIGGGGAAELKEQLDESASQTLGDLVDSVGITSVTGEDDVYVFAHRRDVERIGIRHFYSLVLGDTIRDHVMAPPMPALWPYDSRFHLFPESEIADLMRVLWPCKVSISKRRRFGTPMLLKGAKWYEWQELYDDKLLSPLSLVFAFVASHNHFVLDRGGKVFNRTAPIIKLPADATEDDHLALLGLLNSSAVCFWMKQVSQQRQMTGGDGVRVTSRAQVPYEFAATPLKNLPIPESFSVGLLRDRLLRIARHMDELAHEISLLTASRAIQEGVSAGTSRILEIYSGFQQRRRAIRSQLIFLQEEIDFTAHVMFGFTDKALLCDQWESLNVTLEAGQRPFELLQQRNLDGFPVPSDIPTQWPEVLRCLWRMRMEAIRKSKDLGLIEDDHYKRRWIGRQGLFNQTARQDELKTSCEKWLLDRLEDNRFWPRIELQSTAQLADRASADADFVKVAALYRGRPDFDLAALAAELVEGESVPFLPILRYKPSGLRKREVWESTWDLQRQEDAGKDVGEIPVPPKYTTTDFQKTDYWRLRKGLDVPKERWISYPHCQSVSDSTLVVGWAGWNHLEQATALVTYYDARKREGWDAKRLTPLLAGLQQLLPWIHQWHPEIDKEFGETAGKSYQSMLEQDAHELGLTLEDIRTWQPPQTTARLRTRK
jgi:hypothetical protein